MSGERGDRLRRLPGLKPLPVGLKFGLMQLGPGFHKALLAAGECPSHEFQRVQAVNGNIVCVVNVEMRPVVRDADFHVHTDNDTKKAAKFGHVFCLLSVCQS